MVPLRAGRGKSVWQRFCRPLHQIIYVATRVATPVDVYGLSNTNQHDERCRSNTQQHGMDVCGRTETKVARTSKPLAGILGDVGGRIGPVAPPPLFEYEPDGSGHDISLCPASTFPLIDVRLWQRV